MQKNGLLEETQLEDSAWDVFDEILRLERSEDRQDVQEGPGGLGGVGTGTMCDLCHSTDVIVEDGAHVCRGCFSVLDRVIDQGAEWRLYTNDDSRQGVDPSRCGLPTNDLLPKSSLGSVIGGRAWDSREIRRMRMYQIWNSMPYWERTLYAVFDQLANTVAGHGIPGKVLEDAKVMYKKASEKKISRGENKEGLIASCIYFACKINNVPRSEKEISRIFHISPMTLTKGNTRFQDLLRLNVDSSGPEDYIARYGSRLNMSYDDIQRCKELARKLDEMEIVSDNAHTSVAAGVLSFFSTVFGKHLSKKDIADTCEVSEVTVSKCCKRLMKFREHLVGAPIQSTKTKAT